MTKRRRRILFWTGIAIIVLVVGLRMYYVSFLRGPKIIRTWVQPRDVHIDEHDPYIVALVLDGYDFSWPRFKPRYYLTLLPLSEERNIGLATRRCIAPDWKTLISLMDEWEIVWGQTVVLVRVRGQPIALFTTMGGTDFYNAE